ncbi:MAG TPA: LD-carboxypeptidase [Bacteroidota bacterium]|nr:LD-carboxypeptidase [Bacteroidota bacterium]
MNVLFPRSLSKGDLIGIISPGSPLDDLTRLERGIQYLEKLGYRTLVGTHCTNRMGYLAGTDEERVKDIHTMFADKRVKAVFCTRGGYGSPRILSIINYPLIARNPKIFVGYSDITALSLALWRRCRLVTFHGPMVGVEMAGDMDERSEESLWRLLTGPSKAWTLAVAADDPGRLVCAGIARGRLLGGNLSLIISLLGTPFQPAFRRSLLLLEEIGEEPYRIDRMLAQLRNAGVTSGVAGVALGQFTDCAPRQPEKPSRTLEEVVREASRWSRLPFSSGFPFGHEQPSVTLPLGARAQLDARKGTLHLLESATI